MSEVSPTERIATTSAASAAPIRVAPTVNEPLTAFVGKAVTLTGKFDTTRSITVWGEVWNASLGRWSKTAAVSTDDTGHYRLSLTYYANRAGSQTWRVAGQHADGSIQRTKSITVQRVYDSAGIAAPTVNARPVSIVGSGVSAIGYFDTDAPIKVYAEVWVPNRGRWSPAPVTMTNSFGRYSILLSYNAGIAGTQRWRIVGTHANGYTQRTNEFAVTRVPAPSNPSVGVKSPVQVGDTAHAIGYFDTPKSMKVWAEVWVPNRGRWSPAPATLTNSSGRYSIPLTYNASVAGTQRWRIVGQHPYGITQRSKEFTVTRISTPNVDKRCLTGRVLCASKTTNKMHWMINGRILETVDVRYGRPGYETREGQFEVFWKSRNHVSSLYGSAMPFSMFFSGGQAVHYSSDFARRGWVGGSAGCINVRDYNTLERIYDQVRVGDKVVVYW